MSSEARGRSLRLPSSLFVFVPPPAAAAPSCPLLSHVSAPEGTWTDLEETGKEEELKVR